MKKASAVQVGGSHYRNFAIQPAEFIHKNGLSFLAGNVIKYVCRYKAKNGRDDLLKARHYVDLLLEFEYPISDGRVKKIARAKNPSRPRSR